MCILFKFIYTLDIEQYLSKEIHEILYKGIFIVMWYFI